MGGKNSVVAKALGDAGNLVGNTIDTISREATNGYQLLNGQTQRDAEAKGAAEVKKAQDEANAATARDKKMKKDRDTVGRAAANRDKRYQAQKKRKVKKKGTLLGGGSDSLGGSEDDEKSTLLGS